MEYIVTVREHWRKASVAPRHKFVTRSREEAEWTAGEWARRWPDFEIKIFTRER